jgi:hypothetical protein
MVSSRSSGFLYQDRHDTTEILLKVALNIIKITRQTHQIPDPRDNHTLVTYLPVDDPKINDIVTV